MYTGKCSLYFPSSNTSLYIRWKTLHETTTNQIIESGETMYVPVDTSTKHSHT